MSERKYRKKSEFQDKVISHQLKQIKDLELQLEKAKLEIEEKNEIINSITPLKEELALNVKEAKKYKNESKELVQELRKMKDIVNQEVYRGRWKIVKYLIK